MQIERLTQIIDPKIEKVLDVKQMNSLFQQILESEYEKQKKFEI